MTFPNIDLVSWGTCMWAAEFLHKVINPEEAESRIDENVASPFVHIVLVSVRSNRRKDETILMDASEVCEQVSRHCQQLQIYMKKNWLEIWQRDGR
jgi:hypothetical protein